MITDFKWLDWEKQKFKETQVKRRAILSIRGVSQNSVASSTTGRTNPARPSGSTYLHNWVPHPCFSLTSISSFHRSSWWFCSPQSLPSTVFHHVIWFTLLLLSKEKQKRREGGEKEKREEKRTCFHIDEMYNNKSSVQFSSVAQSWKTLCDPMNCSTPGLPVHHQFPELSEDLILKEDILTSSEEKRVGIVSVKRGNLVK